MAVWAGAFIKDKAFFFGAYEGQRYNVGNSYGGVTSPSMVHMAPNGTCSFGFAGDCADSIPDVIADITEPAAVSSGVIVSPASLLIAGCSAAGASVTCNGKGFPTNNAQNINITNGFNNIVHVDNVVAKVDYKLNENNSISGTYFFGNNSGTVEDFPELQQKWLSDIHTRAQVIGGSWIWTPSARVVNEARFGYNRLYQPTLPGDLNTPASAYGLDTGVSGPETGGLPRIGFGGYFFPGLGGFKWPKFQGPDSITQFVDHISYTVGQARSKIRRRTPLQRCEERGLRQCPRQHHIPGRRCQSRSPSCQCASGFNPARRLLCGRALQVVSNGGKSDPAVAQLGLRGIPSG